MKSAENKFKKKKKKKRQFSKMVLKNKNKKMSDIHGFIFSPVRPDS